MHVFNVHRREISSSADRVGLLIDGLASQDDRLWPHRTWPAMRFDRPGLAAGADGGHGPVGYRVAFHEPGRSVTFSFTNRPAGLVGSHQYLVQSTGPGSCILWHITDITPTGLLRLTWAPFWAPLHDALIEDSLDRAQAAAGGTSAVTRWSRYVRALRSVGARVDRRAGASAAPVAVRVDGRAA